ncbi:NAD+ synthase [Aquirhabdus parva]|uniref:Glutamine-dependent NAD(+) synthetase n=1 Tax=Aquirhabdus parva TaxID=2283318 RepID=A0A345P4D2_9GAMM|nr:NAD+ synthase [Aquirhabdus parva]AXI02141.1 NAD+ synthase [Aquirhabdus parva]
MSVLTLALAQSAFLVGDIAGNTQKIIEQSNAAREKGAQIIVFPELALTGYPPEDLLLRPSLTPRIHAALAQIAAIEGIVVVVGYPLNDTAHKKRFNSAGVFAHGAQRGVYHKQKLPNYSVFDEARYFDAGTDSVIFEISGRKVGLLICEDIWHRQPIKTLKDNGADLVLVLNASPFQIGKQELRRTLLSRRASENEIPLAYVNLVGAQDDLVFDGGSLAINADGQVAAEAGRFEAELLLVNFDLEQNTFVAQEALKPLPKVAEIYQALVLAVSDYVNHSRFPGVIIGLSGGIDSALCLAIAVDALGADRVNAVMMPYRYTAAISMEDAEAQAQRLNVAYHVAEIHGIVDSFAQTLAPLFADAPIDATEENLQARARGTVLMALSNKFGQLVLTTGNKSEMSVGYATLYGDMAGGFDVLKDVYKTQVYELAKFRNSLEETPVIPERVITRPPSAELRPEQTDQDSLPPYDVLDAILYGYIERDMSLDALVGQGFDQATVQHVIHLVDRNEHKRKQSALGPRISGRAFSRERRYPLVNGWTAGE